MRGVCKSVYVWLQTIRIPVCEGFARVQNINIYQVLLKGVVRLYLNAHPFVKATVKNQYPQLAKEVEKE